MDDLKAIFGTRIGNALMRLKIYSIEELKEYVSKHPLEEHKRNWYIWTRIGPKSYERIIDYLKDQG